MIEESAIATPSARWHDGLTRKHWQVLRAGFLGWIFDGYEAMAIIVVLGPMMHSILTPAQATSFSIYAGSVIGITLLGWGLGGIVGGVLADYIGRKRMMMWSIFLYALFSGLTAFANGFVILCALRFLTGLAMGSEWGTGVALVSETWPDRARAKGLGFLHSGFGWGTLVAAIVWYVLSSTHPLGQETWRLVFAVGALPALGVLYLRRGLDESEKWQKAVREKRWHATSNESQHLTAQQPAAGNDKRPFTLKLLFTEPEALRRTVLAMILSAVTTVGWWAISSWLLTYTVTLGKAEGVADPAAWGSRVSITYTIGAIVAYMLSGFIIDILGRRLFMCLTFLGSLLVTVATYKLTSTVEGMAILAPINGFFTLGCAFAWMAIYPVELFTPTVRTSAISMIFNGARLIAWVFPIIAGTLIKSFGGIPNTALTMGSVYLLGVLLPWFLPETTGKKLPE
ncbi:MAG TPA: MFS transporter [Castellaniella sp.]|jgi:MFS family permease|nr:MFS transporter [Castellaniella sp.]